MDVDEPIPKVTAAVTEKVKCFKSEKCQDFTKQTTIKYIAMQKEDLFALRHLRA